MTLLDLIRQFGQTQQPGDPPYDPLKVERGVYDNIILPAGKRVNRGLTELMRPKPAPERPR